MARVVISIVNHENRDLVRACLLSLPAACEGLDWAVTVIDNVSGDGSLEMLAAEFPDVTVIANRTRKGFGANHNQVLVPHLAHPEPREAFLILNDDTTLRPGAVARLMDCLVADPSLAAVVPTIVDTAGRAGANRIAYPTARRAWRTDWTDRTEPPDPDGGFLQGCCLLLRGAALVEVGVFDERFFLFYEDTDLSRRLADAGWALGVCPDAEVVHVGHASVFKPDLVAFTPLQGRRSRYLYFCKHEGRARAEIITLVGRLLLVTRAAKAVAGATIRHNPTSGDRARRLWALARFNPRKEILEVAVRTGSR
jgi:N-acetylglucosaminyl-diphospho-decaprenol L-rhamnosyltransferase